MPEGRIIKALSGFYYIESDGKIYQTRARGIFRKKNQAPLVGDFVKFETADASDGVLTAIHPRKNELVRPPIANVDCAIVVMSAREPDFSTHLVDRFLVYLEKKDIRPILLITKVDGLTSEQLNKVYQYQALYEKIGYTVWLNTTLSQSGVLAELANHVVVVMGQSGVGKSTFLNQLLPELSLETAGISTHLGRGKHTTRHVAIHQIEKAWIADTPGFSTLELMDVELENLSSYFLEFNHFSKNCKFRTCTHLHEPKCHVKEALDDGEIAQSRYDNYQQFMQELQTKKEQQYK